jgi:hypothetical protein
VFKKLIQKRPATAARNTACSHSPTAACVWLVTCTAQTATTVLHGRIGIGIWPASHSRVYAIHVQWQRQHGCVTHLQAERQLSFTLCYDNSHHKSLTAAVRTHSAQPAAGRWSVHMPAQLPSACADSGACGMACILFNTCSSSVDEGKQSGVNSKVPGVVLAHRAACGCTTDTLLLLPCTAHAGMVRGPTHVWLKSST